MNIKKKQNKNENKSVKNIAWEKVKKIETGKILCEANGQKILITVLGIEYNNGETESLFCKQVEFQNFVLQAVKEKEVIDTSGKKHREKINNTIKFLTNNYKNNLNFDKKTGLWTFQDISFFWDFQSFSHLFGFIFKCNVNRKIKALIKTKNKIENLGEVFTRKEERKYFVDIEVIKNRCSLEQIPFIKYEGNIEDFIEKYRDTVQSTKNIKTKNKKNNNKNNNYFQDNVKNSHFKLYGNNCRLSKIVCNDEEEASIASHILAKALTPSSKDDSKYDPENGLMLSVRFDTLIDQHYLTFSYEKQKGLFSIYVHPSIENKNKTVFDNLKNLNNSKCLSIFNYLNEQSNFTYWDIRNKKLGMRKDKHYNIPLDQYYNVQTIEVNQLNNSKRKI